MLGDLAPKFAELNDDVLFGQVCSHTNELSSRDCSMITHLAFYAVWPKACSAFNSVKEFYINRRVTNVQLLQY
ncbi:hypothetical protein [Apilactobacillus xinyiensis]|uniref:hypothetical protein n=1 Tax=Apilactobacillus xinyiensis TaxID=2841032 RepID=UPI001C7DD89C|nr:hypothetical protein [Apilactobacillus xinyiensis]